MHFDCHHRHCSRQHHSEEGPGQIKLLNTHATKSLSTSFHIIVVVGLLALSLDMLVILFCYNHLDNISVSLPGRNMKSSSAVSIFQLSVGT